MNSLPASSLLSPGSSEPNNSLIINNRTDIQDTNSSHRNQHHSPNTSDYIDKSANHDTDNKQSYQTKTEYKSNFTPFDQYVYNEITDSFVRQTNHRNTVSNNLLSFETGINPLSASSSNQDLVAQSEAHAQHLATNIAVSPALEAGVFEPVNGSDANQHNATSEPWYMEVTRRNQKAHEYRFKSELGHNSALLSEQDLVRKSPLGNDPSIEAQIIDKQQQLNTSIRFSPHEFKRDHLISQMANNNNFKLPKENVTGASTSRRTMVASASASRPLTRTTAASRARSQSSKRPTSTAQTKNEPGTKSNQTSPSKNIPSRVSNTTTRVAPKPSPSTPKTTGALANGTAASGRPVTASTTLNKAAPSKSVVATRTSRAAPVVANSAGSSDQKVSSSVTARTASRTSASSSATKFSLKQATRPTSAANRPATNTRLASSRYPGSVSSNIKSANDTSGVSTNAVKSIKTKALVDAGGKTATITTENSSTQSDSNVEPKLIGLRPGADFISIKQEDATKRASDASVLTENNVQAENAEFNDQEPDPIFKTTDSGNMLADEIAQAEKIALAAEREKLEHSENTGVLTCEPSDQRTGDENLSFDKLKSALESNVLINGLEGGLVSAEDHYELSERDASLDYKAQQSGQSCEQHDQSYDHEPYSIMPTTYSDSEKCVQREKYESDTEKDRTADVPKEDASTSTPSHSKELEHEQEDASINSQDEEIKNDHVSSGDMRSTTDERGEKHELLDDKAEEVDHTSNFHRSGSVESHEQSDRDLQDSSDDHKDDTSDSNHDKFAINANETTMEDNEVAVEGTLLDSRPVDFGVEKRELETSDSMATMEQARRSTSSEDEQDLESQSSAAENPSLKTQDEAPNNQSSEVTERLEQGQTSDNFVTVDNGNDSNIDIDDRMEEKTSEQVVAHVDSGSVAGQADQDSLTNKDIQNDTHHYVEEQPHVQSEAIENDHAASGDRESENIVDSLESENSSDDETNINKSELLMNVAELETIESMRKQEMSRKTELARERSGSTTSMTARHPSELLLSVDQLSEHFAQVSVADASDDKVKEQEGEHGKNLILADDSSKNEHHVELEKKDSDLPDSRAIETQDLEQAVSESKADQCPETSADLLNFKSTTPTEHQQSDSEPGVAEVHSNVGIPTGRNDNGSKTFYTLEANHQSIDESSRSKSLSRESSSDSDDNFGAERERHESSVANLENDSNQVSKSTASAIDDEMDEDEQLKLSNHLTNSDDDVILEPRNRRDSLGEAFSPHRSVSPSRYNEGAGLGIMVQNDEQVGSVEVSNGLSAEIVAPTVVENRIEVSTSKSMTPEISQAAFFMHAPKLTQENEFDDDYEGDCNLDPLADPIDVAATMSPSSSVAEEMLRLSRQVSLANALSEMGASDDMQGKSHSPGGGIAMNKRESQGSEKELMGVGVSHGGIDGDVKSATNLPGSSSCSSSSSSLQHQAADAPENKSVGRPSGKDVNPMNNNEIDNVENRKQNIDINSDSNNTVEHFDMDKEKQGHGSPTTVLTARADETVPGDQAKDADVSGLLTN